MISLREKYRKEVREKLKEEFSYKNAQQIPVLEKITVSMGLGEAVQNIKIIDQATSELALITGQKPVVTKARQSVAAYKLRKGMPIGCVVTLRSKRMWDFCDKLINVCLPRVKDFRGISPRAFDGRGNYSLGIKEQLIFPEIDYDKVEKVLGMNVTIVTSAKNDKEAKALLKLLGMPFRK